jgi:rhodanese-related sulfurtransferase
MKETIKVEVGMKIGHFIILTISLLLIAGVGLISSCTEEVAAPVQIIEDMSPQEAFKLIQENQGNPDFIIIDVRTPEEFNEAHIENAIMVNFRSENFKTEINKFDKNKAYLIYCRTGNRSSGALDIMVELGFREIYHLTVGITGWLEEGLPTVQ